jgi:hypothetical protein
MWGGSADDWVADSGIGVRGLLSVARAYEAQDEEEAAAVKMLIVDGNDFLKRTEPE